MSIEASFASYIPVSGLIRDKTLMQQACCVFGAGELDATTFSCRKTENGHKYLYYALCGAQSNLRVIEGAVNLPL